jgi:hypothetical protein
MGPGEGNPSLDGRYLAVNVGDGSDGPGAALPYFYLVDMTDCMPTPYTDCATKKTDEISISSVGISSLDWVSMSPLGTYVVVSRNYQETAVLDWDPATGVVSTTRRAEFSAGHYDMAASEDSLEYALEGRGYMFNLADGTQSALWFTGSGNYHLGAHTDGVIGWGIASDYSDTGSAQGELIAFGTNGRFYRLAHHRQVGATSGALAPPYAVLSPDGKRAFFGSRWGEFGGAIQGYIVDTRTLCP